jgi:hypothetical protein
MSFNFHRFQLLVIKDWTENKRLFFFSLLALVGGWIILFALTMVASHAFNPMVRQILLGFGLFAVAAVAANQQFRSLSTVAGSIRYLHLPASTLEKILQPLTFTFLVILPAALLVFAGTEWVMIQVTNRVYLLDPNLHLLNPIGYKDYFGPVKAYWITYAIFMAGAILFRRMVLVKTGSALFGLLIILNIFNTYLANKTIKIGADHALNASLFESVSIIHRISFQRDEILLPPFWMDFFTYFIYVGIPLFCFIFSYIRLRETEA